MNLLKFVTVLFVSMSLVSSCKKDDTTPSKTPSELLKDGTWKLTNITLAGVSYIETCEKDDTFVFGETKATRNEGATKCNPSDPQSEELAYTLSADGKKLTLDGEEATVKELTASKLVFDATFGGITLTTTLTK